jgi:hypothetical protein
MVPLSESEHMADRAKRRIRAAARRGNVAQPTFPGWIRLESSGWHVQEADFLDESVAAELVRDDVSWFFAVTDWRRRRPGLLQRRMRRAWLAEEQLLAARGARLIEATTHVRTLRPMSDAPG